MGFYAKRPLQKEEELSIDYGWDAQHGRKKTRCLCEAPTCRGFIEKDDTLAIAEEKVWSQLRGVVGTWRTAKGEEKEEGLVGKKVRVFRVALQRYEEGTVEEWREGGGEEGGGEEGEEGGGGRHVVVYGNGREEVFDLSLERWQVWAEEEDFSIAKKRREGGAEVGEEKGVMPALDQSRYHIQPLKKEGGVEGEGEEEEEEEEDEEQVPVPSDAVGMVVGRGGDTIRALVRETGVRTLELKKVPEQRQVQVIKNLIDSKLNIPQLIRVIYIFYYLRRDSSHLIYLLGQGLWGKGIGRYRADS